jgi:hypothetical protein
VVVRPQSHHTFLDGFDLYKARPDKGYSLTNCIIVGGLTAERIPFGGRNHQTAVERGRPEVTVGQRSGFVLEPPKNKNQAWTSHGNNH